MGISAARVTAREQRTAGGEGRGQGVERGGGVAGLGDGGDGRDAQARAQRRARRRSRVRNCLKYIDLGAPLSCFPLEVVLGIC